MGSNDFNRRSQVGFLDYPEKANCRSQRQVAQIDIVKIVVKAVDKVRYIVGRRSGCCGRRFRIGVHERRGNITAASHVPIAAVATDPCKDRCVLVGQKFGILNGTGVRLTGCYIAAARRTQTAVGIRVAASTACTIVGDVGEKAIRCIGSAAISGMACVPSGV
jgi:hypothetical protein